MGSLSTFFVDHFIHIYFLYGLAFFAMGLALLVESRQASQFRLARAGRWLGAFGILHGCHEFVEMFVLISGQSLSTTGSLLRVALLAASFLPLLAFGFQMLPRSEREPDFPIRMLILVIIAFVTQVILVRVTYQPNAEDWIAAVDVLSRYTLAIPGAALAGLALVRQQRVMREQGMARFGRDLGLAAMALAWYGIIGQAFPRPSLIFPSMYVNAYTFMQWFGFPIQLLRGVMAIITAFAMIRALRAFDEEIRRRLEAARQTERELQSAARELSLLYEASSLLTSTSDLQTVLQESIRRIVQVIEPLRAGFIAVAGNGRTDVRYCAAYGYTDDQVEVFKRSVLYEAGKDQADRRACWMDQFGRNITGSLNVSSSLTPDFGSQAIRKVILPLEAGSRQVGALLLETNPAGPYISSGDAPTILALARQLAIAIDNAMLVIQLRQREARRTELLQHTTAAQEAERTRIARELHDETGQALTALALGLKGTQKLLATSPDRATAQIADLQEIATNSLEELRHLISDLRPSHLDDLGLVAALRWYVERLCQRCDTQLKFVVAGHVCRLPPETETTLFRIVQEALNNVVKHARAATALVRLAFKPEEVELCIRDDGTGFVPDEVFKPGAGRAWGLIGIQERVTLAQGKFTVESAPGEGTAITVCIPVSPSLEAASENSGL